MGAAKELLPGPRSRLVIVIEVLASVRGDALSGKGKQCLKQCFAEDGVRDVKCVKS